MMKRGTVRFVMAFAITLIAFTGVYAGGFVGASAGQSSTTVGVDPSVSAFDGSATAYKVLGGYRVIKYFGVEADYRNFGSSEDSAIGSDLTIDTTALDFFAVGVIPIGNFEVFGKAGYSMWDAEVNVFGQQMASDDGNDLAYGLGAAYAFNKFALRLEYEMFDIENNVDVDMLSFGFDFRF